MADMSQFTVTDAPEMPRGTKIRKPRPNPFTVPLEDSDNNRHDETKADGRVVSLGKPKQTAPLNTVRGDDGRPSQFETARNLIRRAAKDMEIGIVTRVQAVDDETAILVFQAAERRVLQTVSQAQTQKSSPVKAADVSPDVADNKNSTAAVTGTNVKASSNTTTNTPARTREAARR
jgi:hypothetical protein